MRTRLAALLLALSLPLAAGAKPQVEITTSAGVIVVELAPDAAPATVANFLAYVDKGFYAGTIFHRVKTSNPAIIQGGQHTADLAKKTPGAAVRNEADVAKAKGLKNVRGALAMARESLPDSAKAQFFINVKGNPSLDFKARTLGDFGYCVFGKVVKGMDVVDRIAAGKTGARGGLQDVPVAPVTITATRRL